MDTRTVVKGANGIGYDLPQKDYRQEVPRQITCFIEQNPIVHTEKGSHNGALLLSVHHAGGQSKTYRDPAIKMSTMPTLRFVASFSCKTAAIGSTKIYRSMPAPTAECGTEK